MSLRFVKLMRNKNILMIMPLIFGVLLAPSIGISFAAHSSGGGSGCSGDCVPPTLGVDTYGKVLVEGGFAINGNSYDVEQFEQTIPTQTIKVNEPVELTLKLFENNGPEYIEYVELVLGNEHVFDSYVWREMPNAEIAWQNTFDGIQSFEVTDVEGLITDVNVEAEIEEELLILKFQFTPTTIFDPSHLKVKMWDQNKSYWLNNFYDSLNIIHDPLSETSDSDQTSTESELSQAMTEQSEEVQAHEDNDSISEDKDVSTDIATEELHCNDGYTRILDNRFENSYCTLDNFAIALINSGMATAI